MDNQLWSWLLTIVGVTGFILAGRKVWWAWYINLACQILWFAYAIVTAQYGFIVAALVYSVVFTQNAVKWTRERRKEIDEWEDISEHNAHAWASPNDARRAMGLQPYEDTEQGRDILAEAERLSREQFPEKPHE